MSGLTKEAVQKMLDDTIKSAFDISLNDLREQQTKNMEVMMLALAKDRSQLAKDQDKGAKAAQLVRALAACRGSASDAAKYVKQLKGGGDASVIKALEASTGTAGGFLVPTELSSEIIELLRPAAVVRRMNPLVLPMDNGALQISKITAGATGGYSGENEDIGEDAEAFGMLNLSWKKLSRLVPLSNDLLRFAAASADTVVRDDLIQALAQREDQAFIRDDGTAGTPKGMRYWANAANVSASAGTTLANVVTDITALINGLENNDVRMIRPGWLLSPRSKNYLISIRDSNGQFVFRDEMNKGMLFGWPYAATNNIPNNLGGGTESEVYFVDFADAVIAEASELIIDASDQASYVSSGTLVSAYSKDQTVIRAIARHDFGMRHDYSVAIKTGVTWGA